jgi:hypothetical protein
MMIGMGKNFDQDGLPKVIPTWVTFAALGLMAVAAVVLAYLALSR